MKWRNRLGRLIVADPKDRDGASPWLAALAVVLGLWLAGENASILSGIAAAVLVAAIGQLLLHLVRRRKRRGSSN